ncbi:uncharacterized protein BJ212DRAFT_148274 [Suillus subaureus]|uniref:Uncharacterized protein n=1 Tax=Suillus subaureus TaxID=48587 RepID=A0A9P7ECN4_9AGAM|nr:uncharacterized protein BJ212DRAFT_148274 [Suillus subaureus]KAG1817056.1 hypothetical protein BJ212DRAFT_148274 [Suillus subaureus]
MNDMSLKPVANEANVDLLVLWCFCLSYSVAITDQQGSEGALCIPGPLLPLYVFVSSTLKVIQQLALLAVLNMLDNGICYL